MTDRVDLDELQELKSRIRDLRDDPAFLAYLLGCEPDQLRFDIDLRMDVEANGLDAVSQWP